MPLFQVQMYPEKYLWFSFYIKFLIIVGILITQNSGNNKTMNYEIGSIRFTLPEKYIEINKTTEKISSKIPDGQPTIEYFLSFKNSKGNDLFLFYWIGYPIRDRGPMSEKEAWNISIAGRTTKLIRTAIFMGIEQEVLVAHSKISENEYLMVFTPNIEVDEFKNILKIFKMK